MEIPFNILKKTIYIRDTDYKYSIDEDGNGKAWIDGFIVFFEVNSYGEILAETIHC